MAALVAGNAEAHVSDIKALRRTYQASGAFEMLGPKVSEATAENPTKFKVHLEI